MRKRGIRTASLLVKVLRGRVYKVVATRAELENAAAGSLVTEARGDRKRRNRRNLICDNSLYGFKGAPSAPGLTAPAVNSVGRARAVERE